MVEVKAEVKTKAEVLRLFSDWCSAKKLRLLHCVTIDRFGLSLLFNQMGNKEIIKVSVSLNLNLNLKLGLNQSWLSSASDCY